MPSGCGRLVVAHGQPQNPGLCEELYLDVGEALERVGRQNEVFDVDEKVEVGAGAVGGAHD